MEDQNRIRDNKEIYCFCKSNNEIDKYRKHFRVFKILAPDGASIKGATYISEFTRNDDAVVYVNNRNDKILLNHLQCSIIILNDRDKLPCHKYFLSINSFGDVHPCCRQNPSMLIGNVRDLDILTKIRNFNPTSCCQCSIGRFLAVDNIFPIFHMNIELAGYCNGQCIYCFQRNLPTFNKEIQIYKQLDNIVESIRPKSIMVFGGEVGIQQKTISLLKHFSDDYGVSVSLATNGDFSTNTLEELSSFIQTFQVTFNGFSTYSVSAVSKLNFLRQKKNTEYLLLKNKISIKFLINPINVLELPTFLEWACNHPFDHIIIDVTIVTPDNYMANNDWGESIFASAPTFWSDVFSSLSTQIKSILIKKSYYIVYNNVSLLICPEIKKYLHLDNNFFRDIGLENNLEAKSVCISTKAWRTLLSNRIDNKEKLKNE